MTNGYARVKLGDMATASRSIRLAAMGPGRVVLRSGRRTMDGAYSREGIRRRGLRPAAAGRRWRASAKLQGTMGMPPLTHEPLAALARHRRVAAPAWVTSRGAMAAAAVVAGAILLPIYDRLSATAPITADSANAVLQGRSMADGNVLLTGWTLSGASFYATDLPFYAAVTAIRGISPLAAHDVGAAIYTLLVLAACFLARGRTRGLVAAGRMVVTLLLLIAPAPGPAVQLLLLGPFHAGTTLLLLLALLALDAADRRPLAAVA